MIIYDKNYSGLIDLYEDPDAETGYVGTMQFQILTSDKSAIIKVLSNEPLTLTWNIRVKEGKTTWGANGVLIQEKVQEVDITEQRPSAIHYDDWEISVSAQQVDDTTGKLLYSGYYNAILPVPKEVSGMKISTNEANSDQTIILSWDLATNSTNDINFPIQQLIIQGHYFNSIAGGWMTTPCFKNTINLQDEKINGLLCSADTVSYNLDLSTLIPEKIPENPITFSINPFLYWENSNNTTENYKITPIFGSSNVGYVRLTINFVETSKIILYVKNSEGDFLLGKTMFIKNSQGNWLPINSIQQFN